MNPTGVTQETVRRKLAHSREKISQFFSEWNNPRLLQLWTDWNSRLGDMIRNLYVKPEVSISLVGGTGAGKSTLLNALIGSRVLPVSNMRACTAAISEVTYSDGDYSARVEFIPRDSWEREVAETLQEIVDFKTEDPDDTSRHPDTSGISKSASDKLWAVYRPSDETSRESFSFASLREPLEIKEAFDQGVVEFATADLTEFRTKLRVYLDSSHRFWPIVKTVSIRGPFTALSDGAKIIDLPGVNDPNEAREEVTRQHLKTCRFVWIVFNIRRALTKDTLNLMQSDDFLRQVVMDGRADSLTFVGTASDDLDIESAIEELHLPEDTETAEIIRVRNDAVRSYVREQVDELAGRLAKSANESPEIARQLGDKMKSSQILTVSSKQYLRLQGLSRDGAVILNDIEETEIPALQRHLRSVTGRYGIEAHVAAIDRQLQILLSEIDREVKSQCAALDNTAKVSERQWKEIQVAIDAARTFLERDLVDTQERLAQDLEASQQLLGERIKRATERGRTELKHSTVRNWETIHHATLAAICRNGGVHTGVNGKRDFPADLCKPIFTEIAFAWADFFGDKLKHILAKWTLQLNRKGDDYRSRLFDGLGKNRGLPPSLTDGLSESFDSAEQIINELLAQIGSQTDEKIISKQRTLYERVPSQVKANMQPAFAKAKLETGRGMKKRMIEILAEHAASVSQVMFDDAQEELLQGIRSLNNWLETQFLRMTETVKRHATLAAENLTAARDLPSTEQVDVELKSLKNLASILMELAA